MKIKKIAALLLTMVIGASIFTGCSKNYQSVVTIDGVDIAPNVYLYTQFQVYLDATEKVEDQEQDILKQTIEDMPAADWIHQETIKSLQTKVWINKTFEEKALAITEEEQANIYAQAEYYWQLLSEMYTENGIGIETYKTMMLDGTKSAKIFDSIYAIGSEKEPTDKETSDYLNDNYARGNGFYLSKKATADAEAIEENVIKLAEAAQQAVKELNEGADFDETLIKYMSIGATITGSEEEYTDAQANTTNIYVASDSADFPEEFVKTIFGLEKNGEYAMAELEDRFFVYQRIDTYKDEAELATLKPNIISEMKNEEYVSYVEEQAHALEVTEDAAAVKYYSLSKIKF